MSTYSEPTTNAAARPHQHSDTLTSSSPVELSQLDASAMAQQPHTEPYPTSISPMTPGVETFATPPQSARHSTFGAAPPPGQTGDNNQAGDREEEQAQAGLREGTTTLTTDGATDEKGEAIHDADNERAGVQPVGVATGGIGPATSTNNLPATADASSAAMKDAVYITLLNPSGVKHLFVINSAYLAKHNIGQTDPWKISVYTLKELIWRDWREEWEERPTSPGSVRLICFGRLLGDRDVLKGESPFLASTDRDRKFTTMNVQGVGWKPASS